MSIETMSLVLNHSRAKGTAKVVLLGIANHDGDGGAWPSIATLMRYANVDRRTVQRSIAELVELGELVVGDQQGGTRETRSDRRPNLYTITVSPRPEDGAASVSPRDGAASVSPRALDGAASVTGRGGVCVADGAASVPPEPSLNHPEPSSPPHKPPHDGNVAADAFDAFWEAYPRRTAKKAARKAFAKAARDTDPAVIVEGARRMAVDPNLPELTFIPHPATWLNQGRWDDPPYPPRAGRPTTDDRVRDALALAARLDGHGDYPAIGAGR